MKKHIFCLIACFLLAACNGQGSNVGFGVGMSGYSSRFVKMDPHAREVATDYLTASYKHQCGGYKAKHNLQKCKLDRPFLTAGSLPVGVDYHSLPQEVMNRIGSIPPGTDLVQSGWSVYLIHWTDKIIYDSVSLHPYWKESLRK